MPDPITPDPNVQDWKTALPEEIRGNESLATLKDVGELAKGYLDLNTKVAAIPVAPESADKYTAELPELPEGVTKEEAQAGIENLRKYAFENGLSQKQFESSLAQGLKELSEGKKAQLAEYKAEMGKLETEWGADHAAKLDLATKTAEKLGAPAWMTAHPDGLRFFAKLGPKFSEEETPSGKPGDGSPTRDAKTNPAAVLYPGAN